MGLEKTIVWVATHPTMDNGTYIDDLRYDGYRVDTFTNAQAAVSAFQRTRYDLIVTGAGIPALAIGEKYADPRMEQIVKGWGGGHGLQTEIVLRMMELARQEPSLNGATPILVADVYEPENDDLIPGIRAKFLRAGAVGYYSLLDDVRDPLRHPGGVVGRIKELLRS